MRKTTTILTILLILLGTFCTAEATLLSSGGGWTALDVRSVTGTAIVNETRDIYWHDEKYVSGGAVDVEIHAIVQTQVIRDADGTLDFWWRVTNGSGTLGVIGEFRLGRFANPAAYDPSDYNAHSDVTHGSELTVDAMLNNFSWANGYVNVRFNHADDDDDNLYAGQSAEFYFDTNAKNYGKTASFDLSNEYGTRNSVLFDTYAPAPGVAPYDADFTLPLPGALVLLAPGLAGLAVVRRKMARRS